MSAVVWNIAIGLMTSVLSGGSVWLWQRVRAARIMRRRSAFFGVEPGDTCLIIMNNKWSKPGSTAHSDVHALMEVAALVDDLGAKISAKSSDEVRESNGNRTEFCIGGPWGGSNSRTGGHISAHLPGVRLMPYGSGPDSMGIIAGERTFLCDRGNQEYALVAKFTPTTASRPVFVICGQTSIGNRAAVHLLKRDYRSVLNVVATPERFCVMIVVKAIAVYGHEAAEVAGDVTDAAFEPLA